MTEEDSLRYGRSYIIGEGKCCVWEEIIPIDSEAYWRIHDTVSGDYLEFNKYENAEWEAKIQGIVKYENK